MTNTKKEKPRLTHIDKSMRVDGKWTPQHTEAVKMADRIFNSSTREQPLREKPNVKRPGRRKR